jgi:hypothetical protein
MRVLGLDLSSHAGWAILESGDSPILISYGTEHFNEIEEIDGEISNFRSLRIARAVGDFVLKLVSEHNPDYIVVEATNAGSFRGSQSLLEYIHAMVLDRLYKDDGSHNQKIFYCDTSLWRSRLQIKLSKEQKKHNRKVSEAKRAGKKTSKKGEGKLTWKHLSVNYVNNKYNLQLKLVMNDACDAICLAEYGLRFAFNKENKPIDLDAILK